MLLRHYCGVDPGKKSIIQPAFVVWPRQCEWGGGTKLVYIHCTSARVRVEYAIGPHVGRRRSGNHTSTGSGSIDWRRYLHPELMRRRFEIGGKSAHGISSCVRNGSPFRWKKPGSRITRGKSQIFSSVPRALASATWIGLNS